MAAGGTASAIRIGPGRLWVGPIGSPDPASASAAIPSAYRAVGYTEDGSVFSVEPSFSPVYVDEELDPIRWEADTRLNVIAFQMAEMTRRNLVLAVNAGSNGTNDASVVGPTAPGSETRVKIIWDSADDAVAAAGLNSRMIFYRCLQTGKVELKRKKGAGNKSLLPATFSLEKDDTAPAASNGFWLAYPNSAFLI